MKIIVKGSFERDLDKVHSKELRHALDNKITQVERAKGTSNIIGLKRLEGYSHHYRIIVKSDTLSYRIGAIIRGEKIWLVCFLPRRKVYKSFP